MRIGLCIVRNNKTMFYYNQLDESSKEKLVQLIKQLPERYKEALFMAEIEDASPSAIAGKLNLKYNTDEK